MLRLKLTVKGRGPDGLTFLSLEAYRGKIWITCYDCPFTCEAILDPTQADNLISLIHQTTEEAREYRL
jgi:hypothetical protein